MLQEFQFRYLSWDVAIYISSDYIVRQTIMHFSIACTTMKNNKTEMKNIDML